MQRSERPHSVEGQLQEMSLSTTVRPVQGSANWHQLPADSRNFAETPSADYVLQNLGSRPPRSSAALAGSYLVLLQVFLNSSLSWLQAQGDAVEFHYIKQIFDCLEQHLGQSFVRANQCMHSAYFFQQYKFCRISICMLTSQYRQYQNRMKAETNSLTRCFSGQM